MSPDLIVPLISALLGAAIGSAGSVLTVLIQAQKEERKHIRDTAVQMALADRGERMQLAKERGGAIYPLSLYLAYHLEVSELLSKNKISDSSLKDLASKMDRLLATVDEIEKERRQKSNQR